MSHDQVTAEQQKNILDQTNKMHFSHINIKKLTSLVDYSKRIFWKNNQQSNIIESNFQTTVTKYTYEFHSLLVTILNLNYHCGFSDFLNGKTPFSPSLWTTPSLPLPGTIVPLQSAIHVDLIVPSTH